MNKFTHINSFDNFFYKIIHFFLVRCEIIHYICEIIFNLSEKTKIPLGIFAPKIFGLAINSKPNKLKTPNK